MGRLMEFEALYARHAGDLEDFWGRRENELRFQREFAIFGHSVRMASNQAGVLAAADFSRPLYSTAPLVERAPLTIRLVVRPAPLAVGPVPPVPGNLFSHIQYTGEGDWLALQLGAWGHCQVDLAAGRALAVLTPELAEQPEIVSRCLLNTLFNNLLTARGLSMLHATSLVRSGRVLLLIAPHHTGKSTSALSLALAGYPLMSDSQVYITPQAAGLSLTGFPVGRVKLRRDMVPSFPELRALLTEEDVRGETKFVLDLRQLNPALVHDAAIVPSGVELCLLTRHADPATILRPATREAVMEAAMLNSLHYDRAEAWRPNVAAIERLVDMARWHHLLVGTDAGQLVGAVDELWADTAP